MFRDLPPLRDGTCLGNSESEKTVWIDRSILKAGARDEARLITALHDVQRAAAFGDCLRVIVESVIR
jgi:hypothetical protein